MTQIKTNCPYCKTKNIAMETFGAWYYDNFQRPISASAYIAICCVECNNPTFLDAYPTSFVYEEHFDRFVNAIKAGQDVQYPKDFFEFESVLPPEGIKIPPHLPMSIEATYRKAKELQAMDGFLEESATNYRKAIERAIKATHPEVYIPVKKETVNLYTAIERLATQNIIPESMKHLAHGIRLIGNEATHSGESDLEGITADQVKDASAFTEAFLTYLISLPEQLHQQFPDNQEFKSPLVAQRDEDSVEQSPE